MVWVRNSDEGRKKCIMNFCAKVYLKIRFLQSLLQLDFVLLTILSSLCIFEMNLQLGIDITYEFFLLSLLFGYYRCSY